MFAINNFAKWLTVGLFATHALACNFHKPPAATSATASRALAQPANDQGLKGRKVQIPYYPLRSEQDLDRLMAQIGEARVVLLGEASHGTREYYLWRAALSKRLIQEKGFSFIAVEGEWADSYRVNNFIKGPRQDSTAAVKLLGHYNRWPTWMWGNHEVASLVTWLNNYNQLAANPRKIGFFGLDVYCVWESLADLGPTSKAGTPEPRRPRSGPSSALSPTAPMPSSMP